jgi:anti-sigma factor RsiW
MNEPGCKMLLLTQADFDGELDAAHAAEIAVHRAACGECQAAYAALDAVRTTIRAADLYQAAPAALRQRLADGRPQRATMAAAKPRWWTMPAVNFGFGAALAAGIALLVMWTGEPNMVNLVIDDHIRALQPGHLQDVASTDRHTVKPWFEGRLDFAPPVKDLAAEHFPLKGGRLDFLNGRPVAALVYQGGTHPIDLLVWPATDDTPIPTTTQRHGFTAIHWTQNGMTLWAVSDIERAQLEDFVRLWRAAP